MQETAVLKLLFIVNPASGKTKSDWPLFINKYFLSSPHSFQIFELPGDCGPQKIKDTVAAYKPDRVVAAGGDGTVKLVAECLLHSGIPLGILPAGSANGLAKELNIPAGAGAIDICVNAPAHAIHLVKINDEICIHLCDIGFNALLIREFDKGGGRGMWGYFKACVKVLWNQPSMKIKMHINNQSMNISARMVVVANATKYGTGALINPQGELTDDLFEVIVVKQTSFSEIFKMMVTHKPYDPAKTEVFQTGSLQMLSKRRVYFQVDGEYLGKVKKIEACIVKGALALVYNR